MNIMVNSEMKKKMRVFFMVVLIAMPVSVIAQEETSGKPEQLQNQDTKKLFEESEQIAQKIAVLTGTAVNPLYVVSAVGLYKYYTTPAESRSQLSWFYSPWYLTTCLVLALITTFPGLLNFINLPPQISKIFDLGGKKLGLAMTSPVVIDNVTAIARYLAGGTQMASNADQSYVYASFISSGWLPGASEFFWFIAIIPMLLFVFFAIWLLNYVFDVFIFLCPFGWLDVGLKLLRVIFYTVLLAVAVYIPQLVFVLVVPIAFVSVLLFGWSVRRAVMGLVFLMDFINRKKEISIDEKGISVFSGTLLDLPSKCYGRLTEKDGNLLFSYRKFFLLERTKTINTTELVLKKGFLYSSLYNKNNFICSLPPRYQKITEKVQARLGIRRIEDSALKKGLKGIAEWVKGLFRKEPAAAF